MVGNNRRTPSLSRASCYEGRYRDGRPLSTVSGDLVQLRDAVEAHIGLFKLSSPPSIRSTWRLWSRLAKRPATTHPADPPPHTMISYSSGIVILIVLYVACEELQSGCNEISLGSTWGSISGGQRGIGVYDIATNPAFSVLGTTETSSNYQAGSTALDENEDG